MNWPATAAASFVATLAASFAIHEFNFSAGSTPEAIKQFLSPDVAGLNYHTSTSRSYTSHHIVHRRNKVELGGGEADNFYLDEGDQKYARDFSRDPDAGEYTKPDELQGIIEDLAGNARLGYEVKNIKITGYASAEDDSPDGGLTTPSEKNLLLARTRAEKVKDSLEAAMDQDSDLDQATRDTFFTFGEPQEQELTESQVSTIDKLAHESGFDSAKQFIDAWNTGQDNVSEADGKVLSNILGKARRVDVYVTYAPRTKDVITDKKYCVRYDITDIHTQKHHQRGPLPLPFPVLVPIPRLRRKAGDDAPEFDGSEDQTAGPEPEPKQETEPEPETTDGPDTEEIDIDTARGAGAEPQRLEADYARENDFYRSRGGSRKLAGLLMGLLGAGALFVNVSGDNCRGDGHTPRPLLVDAVWETIDDISGRGADVSQTISLGIPFVSSAQVNLDKVQGNIWDLDGEKPCEKPEPAASGPVQLPRCSEVDIVRRNGKTVTKRTVYQAPPLSTMRVVKQHR